MEYRNLGRSGLKVSQICLGTMTFGHSADEAETRALVDRALAAGINFFDTANSYAGGQSETLLGRALHKRRSQAVVATKFFNPVGPGPNDSGCSRAHLIAALEDSLRRLRSDYVDLYYIHHVDTETPLDETLRALDDLVRAGKVRYIGCCNQPAWRMMDGLARSAAGGLAAFICHQLQYSLVVRDIEQEIVPACLEKGVGVAAWAPLAGGFLAGGYAPGERRREGSRSDEGWAFPEPFFSAAADDVLRVLGEIAAESSASPASIALRWLIDRPTIATAIVGARNVAQLEDNLQALALRLDDDQRTRLDEISALNLRYPESMERYAARRRLRALHKTQDPGR